MPELDPNQVKLRDGRVVTMRETNGRDEIAASQMLGSHFTQDGAGISLYTKALVMRAVVSIDGKPAYSNPVKFKDFNAFWADIKTADSQSLIKMYQKLNGDSDDPLDEASEGETDESELSQTVPPSENQ